MAKLLVLANLELSLELPDDAELGEPGELARRKERALLRALRRLVREDPRIKGSVETLEFEAFSYASPLEAEATGYYYNRHEEVERL